MSDHAALIERARKLGGHSRTTDAIMRRLADALEAATARTDREPQPGDGPDYHAEHASWLNRNRAVVEAQALEQAADNLIERGFPAAVVPHILRARAVEIRERRQ